MPHEMLKIISNFEDLMPLQLIHLKGSVSTQSVPEALGDPTVRGMPIW
jgi:hypothetical protein